jgi:hypothetical protein
MGPRDSAHPGENRDPGRTAAPGSIARSFANTKDTKNTKGASRQQISDDLADWPRAPRALVFFVSLVVPLQKRPDWVPAFTGMSGV